MVKAAGLLGERQHVGAAPVGDLDVPLFDVDVRGAVLTHGAQLDQVDRWIGVSDGVEEIQRPTTLFTCV